MKQRNLALYGLLLVLVGAASYLFGVIVAIPRRVLLGPDLLLGVNEAIVWYSGAPMIIGLIMILLDVFVLYPRKRKNDFIRYDPLDDTSMTAVLTAYNDELSIQGAVADFLSHPKVRRVIVVSNNSKDATIERAAAAGAIVFNEEAQGYGPCVLRALREGVAHEDTALTVLCEGDLTFNAYDIDKLLAYIAHADIVNGTRTVEQLRDKDTQLSTFMFYGNLFVAKLLEIKHLGNATLTDVGTTYKLCRNDRLRELVGELDPRINLEFNPYLIDKAMQRGLTVIECPITFHKRVGVSKGGNVNNFVALKLGLRMIRGIVSGWR